MFIDDDECRYFENDHAVDEFCEVIGKIEDELDELTEMAQNRMDLIPQEITWGTVGAARHILLRLRQAKAYAKRAGHEPQEGGIDKQPKRARARLRGMTAPYR